MHFIFLTKFHHFITKKEKQTVFDHLTENKEKTNITHRIKTKKFNLT